MRSPVRPRLDARAAGACAAASVGVLVCAGLVWQASASALVARTANPGNGIATGTVSLSDDDGGGAIISASDLGPGEVDRSCLVVTYGGSLAADVRMTVDEWFGDQDVLEVTVQEGTGGGPGGSCTGFAAQGSPAYDGLIDDFPDTYATGVGTFDPTGPATRTYRVTVAVVDDPDAVGAYVGDIVLEWEARST